MIFATALVFIQIHQVLAAGRDRSKSSLCTELSWQQMTVAQGGLLIWFNKPLDESAKGEVVLVV